MSRPARYAGGLRFAKLALLAVVLMAALVYAADALRVRVRGAGAPDMSETLTFHLATRLKNRKLEIFYDQPQTEVCVRALFPHAGRRPCWYARREPVHVVE